MSLIGQPESYSDMLKRIFAATLTAGIICTVAVARVSPAVRDFLDSWDAEVGIGILNSIKALYVLIPLLLAVLIRVFRVHDKVSDPLGLRRHFDIQHILKPLADGVGFPTDGTRWLEVRTNRDLLMRRTFFRYASFKEPKIDGQLVRTAADQWAWFWCMIEPQVVLLITGIIFATIAAWIEVLIVLSVILILAVTALILWPQLKTGAKAQVTDILTREDWKTEIRAAFNDVLGGQESAAQQGDAADGPQAARC